MSHARGTLAREPDSQAPRRTRAPHREATCSTRHSATSTTSCGRRPAEELGLDKLSPLLRLRFHDSMADATRVLGPAEKIREAFSGFQRFLYVG